jgi:hypothetical protein
MDTELAPAMEPSEVAAISADLGFRASDLVQSNAVVWVEGPSDRIYVRFWLNEMDPHLVEGVHYTLMFYGGALLRHLSPDDPAVKEFISLPRINRNFAVVIDSDRSSRSAPLNATKARVRKAIEESGSRPSVWITSGYTIENYVPRGLLAAAVERVHPSAHLHWDADRYTNPFGCEQLGGRSSPADKTAVAQAVVESWAPETPWLLDLKKQIAALAALLRRANDLSPT